MGVRSRGVRVVKSLCKNPELENLVCSGNKITRLDVSKNKKMKISWMSERIKSLQRRAALLMQIRA